VVRLGKGKIIEGLEVGISTMKKNETSLFLIQPHLAYGKLGCLPRIPPNSEVLFKVKIVDFLDNGYYDTYEDLNTEEKKKFVFIEKIVKDLIQTANYNVSRKKITQGIRE
jgi:FK506-binding protein 6